MLARPALPGSCRSARHIPSVPGRCRPREGRQERGGSEAGGRGAHAIRAASRSRRGGAVPRPCFPWRQQSAGRAAAAAAAFGAGAASAAHGDRSAPARREFCPGRGSWARAPLPGTGKVLRKVGTALEVFICNCAPLTRCPLLRIVSQALGERCESRDRSQILGRQKTKEDAEDLLPDKTEILSCSSDYTLDRPLTIYEPCLNSRVRFHVIMAFLVQRYIFQKAAINPPKQKKLLCCLKVSELQLFPFNYHLLHF